MARGALKWPAALLVLYLAAPVAVFLARSAAHPGAGFGVPGLWGALAVSAEAATVSALLLALLGVPLAYLLAHHRGRLARSVGTLVQLPLALPPLMSGVVLLYVFGPDTWLGRLAAGRFTESLAGIVLAQSFVSAPFLVVGARAAFASVDTALEDMAATAGAGPLARFTRVAVPVAAPGIRAGLLLAWLRAFGEYGATVMLAYHPYSLPVFTYVQFSAVGLPATQAPALLSLALAAAVTFIARAPLAGTARKLLPAKPLPGLVEGAGPAPEGQPARPRAAVSFDLSVLTGTFLLQVAHRATSHRLAVVGPSGAGKSMTLRALAGLSPGTVRFGQEDVSSLPPELRRVGYVPQGQALLPHLDAWHNVMFGARAVADDARHWMEALQIADLARRRPGELSGGQRQRVALARALSCRPRLLLLDEPFTGLDAPARAALLHRLRWLQLESGFSSVLVTHDFREAALLADEVVVLDRGRVLQAGRAADVARAPCSPQVASLLGWRNLAAGTAVGPGLVSAGPVMLATGPHGCADGAPVNWSVHPARVQLLVSPVPGSVAATVADTADLGGHWWCRLQLGLGVAIEVELAQPPPAGTGRLLWAYAPPEAFTVWPVPPPAARQ